MYTILLNGSIIADSYSTDDRVAILSGNLRQEVNMIDELEFEIARKHYSYNAFHFGDTVELKHNDEMIFRGFVSNIKIDTLGRKKITCDGMLGLFNYSIVRQFSSSTKTPSAWLQQIITWHNNQMNEGGISGRTFTLGTVQITTPSLTIEQTDYDTCYNFLSGTIVDGLGGYLVYRYENGVNYIDYLSSIGGTTSDQPIAPEINLLEFSSKFLSEEFCTRFIPLGATQEDGTRLKITSVNPTGDHLDDTTLMQTYGSITLVEIYDNIDNVNTLLAVGQKRFNELKKLRNKVTINALDVCGSNPAFSDDLGFMDSVKIIDSYHNINATAVVMAKSTDLTDNTNNKVTFELTI